MRRSTTSPLLLRALNLAIHLKERYPDVIDGRYFERILGRIKVEVGNPDRPSPPAPPDATSGLTSPNTSRLGAHGWILALQSAPQDWIDDIITRLQTERSIDDPDWQLTTKLATDLLKATSQKDMAKARGGIEVAQRASAALPHLMRENIRLAALSAMASLGILPDTKAALSEAEDHVNGLARSGLLDVNTDIGRSEALRVLLSVALSQNASQRDQIDETIDGILASLLEISSIPPIHVQLFLALLSADFEWCCRYEQIIHSKDTPAKSAMRMVRFAQKMQWPQIEVEYLQAGLALMMRIDPIPHSWLGSAWLELGRVVHFHGEKESGTGFIEKAIYHLDLSETDPLGVDIRSLKITALNDLGWSLIHNGRFPEALAALETAYTQHLENEADRRQSDLPKSHLGTATICHNLAEVYLALGASEKPYITPDRPDDTGSNTATNGRLPNRPRRKPMHWSLARMKRSMSAWSCLNVIALQFVG